ncbi:Nicotinamidase-related amidase [Oribacterium sp. KHPX15]|uniref:cysteine hydrolase family protein n=1 Tax=Oribacterium sp. KHPX15 TaxID=1855342 RepID=UPI000894DE69|nr:isochorismatase family cysteine hydrolase [Oribacterium sp. KHPX15]SEA36406.1 Nicotinamidase-related amidase [Oribacterium sp. KHPX15]
MKKEDLVLVIDMQKVYMKGNPWACENVGKAAENISKLLDRIIDLKEKSEAKDKTGTGDDSSLNIGSDDQSSRRSNGPEAPEVMLTRFIAPAEGDAIGVWNDYNNVNKEINDDHVMEEFIPEIARYAEDFPYYDKSTYSCFSHPYIRAAADRAMVHGGDIVLTGVVSECCVLSTFFQGADLGYRFVYLRDACAGLNDETEKATLKILEGLAPLHVRIMMAEEYL